MKKYVLKEPSKVMDDLFPNVEFYCAMQYKDNNVIEIMNFCEEGEFRFYESVLQFKGKDEIFFLTIYDGDYIIKDFGYGSRYKQISKVIFEQSFKEYEEVH